MRVSASPFADSDSDRDQSRNGGGMSSIAVLSPRLTGVTLAANVNPTRSDHEMGYKLQFRQVLISHLAGFELFWSNPLDADSIAPLVAVTSIRSDRLDANLVGRLMSERSSCQSAAKRASTP